MCQTPAWNFCRWRREIFRVLLSEDHPLAKKRKPISFQDLAHEDILMYEKGTSYVEVRLEREFAARNITWNIQHYFSNFSTIYDLVSQNFGISFTMPTTSPILSELPGLVTVPFEEPMEYEIGLAWGKNKYLSSGCRELIRFICSYYEKNYEEKPASVIRAPKDDTLPGSTVPLWAFRKSFFGAGCQRIRQIQHIAPYVKYLRIHSLLFWFYRIPVQSKILPGVLFFFCKSFSRENALRQLRCPRISFFRFCPSIRNKIQLAVWHPDALTGQL